MLTQEQIEGKKRFIVGMADLMVSHDPNLILCTFPLGACLGVAIYDPLTKVGGLLHSMLPDSTIDAKRAAARPGMFLDTGLARLLEHAGNLKAKKENLQVYIAGAGEILDETACFNVGKRNCAVLKELIAKHGMRITAEDVGGLTNRSMQLDVATGEVRLKFSGEARMRTLCKP
jgi:chemotaxis protein CheD